MARRCELTGKGALKGHKVSHAQNKTLRHFLPNIQAVRLRSEALSRIVRLRLPTRTLRTVDFAGGLDAYLRNMPVRKLTKKGQSLKTEIEKKTKQGETTRASGVSSSVKKAAAAAGKHAPGKSASGKSPAAAAGKSDSQPDGVPSAASSAAEPPGPTPGPASEPASVSIG